MELDKRGISGLLLIAISVLHTVFGFVKGYGPLAEIVRAGFFNVLAGHSPRLAIVWFLFFGFLIFLLGHLCMWIERHLKRPVPGFLGWELVVLSLIGVALMGGGFWLLMAIAVYIIVGSTRQSTGCYIGITSC